MKKNQLISEDSKREWKGFRYPKAHRYKTWFVLLAWTWPLLSLIVPFLKKSIVKKLQQQYPGCHITIGALRAGFFRMDLSLQNLGIRNLAMDSTTTADLTASSLHVRLNPSGLRKGVMPCSIRIEGLNTAIVGRSSMDDLGEISGNDSTGNLPPVVLESLKISNAMARYSGFAKDKPVAVNIENIQLDVSWFSILPSTGLPASVSLKAGVWGGRLDVHAKANPEACAFDLDLRAENVNMFRMNDLLRVFGKFDVHEGELSLYAELAGKNGAYKGYVKPVIRHLDIVGPEDKGDSILRKLWERLVGAVLSLLKNRKHDQIATRIDIEGQYDVKINFVKVVAQALRNAFVKAIWPGLDNSILLAQEEGKGN